MTIREDRMIIRKKTQPTPIQDETFVIELTGEQLARIIALSFKNEGGGQFPTGEARIVYQIQHALANDFDTRARLNAYLADTFTFSSEGPIL